MFLVLCNRIFSVLYAFIMLEQTGQSWRPQTKLWKYAAASFSNMLSTWCQYESLRHVSLVLQTMAKTFKMLPTMLMGIIVSKKQHTMKDVLTVALITVGITCFVVGGDIKAEHASGSSWYGLLLLFGFLFFDGFTSTFQEKLFRESHMSKYNQMLYMNLSSAVVGVASLVLTRSVLYCYTFLTGHPEFATDVVLLSLSATAGQFYIFSMVQEFGALALAAAMNARQITTICASYVLRPQYATLAQSLGLLLLFSGLIMKSLWSLHNWQNLSMLDSDKTSPAACSPIDATGTDEAASTPGAACIGQAMDGSGDDADEAAELLPGDQQADSTPMPNPFGDFLESVPQLSPKSPTLTADLLEQWLVARAWLRWRRSSSSIFRLIGSCTVHPVHVAEGSEEKTDLRTEAASGKIRRFHETFKHFHDIAEDQFDFHNYCLRKTTLKAYVAMLRMQERLYSHRFYRRAAKDAINIYLELFDAKARGDEILTTEGASASAEAELSAEEKKKLKHKKKREAQKEAQKVSEKPSTGKPKKVDDDPDGEKLLQQDAMEQANKIVRNLVQHSSLDAATHVLTYEVFSRQGKVIHCLQALRKLWELAGYDNHHYKLIAPLANFCFKQDLENSSVPAVVREVALAEIAPILTGQDGAEPFSTVSDMRQAASKLVDAVERRIKESKDLFLVEVLYGLKCLRSAGRDCKALLEAWTPPGVLCLKESKKLLDYLAQEFGKDSTAWRRLRQRCLEFFPLMVIPSD
ncbi:Adenosine 3'-phospho 5'-phosphosulfate transporter 1 [Symbiodinium microadriaticum]|uniref:Adenosine 3'-phospho 5'-phosphosulfate transporter 1 n=1 Tax=Symbiodinium microadriaticum TaxID=2951 RepID=A0A1Q9DLF6_SYMMI|nr:Adenosine 3'-phospho 5'-phosphosulfate transporter 1 [Symbiodinium microadriaticum]